MPAWLGQYGGGSQHICLSRRAGDGARHPGLRRPGDSNDPKEGRSAASMRLREVAGRHPRELIAVWIKDRAALPWTAIFISSPNAMR